MPKIAGNLLITRKVLTLPNGLNDVDTGLVQTETNFVLGQPGLSTNPGRVMVIPIGNTGAFQFLTLGEPTFSPVTNTVHVPMTNSAGADLTINVLFIDPNTWLGPGYAERYNSSVALGGSVAGNLLWSRRHITLAAGANVVDTFIKQVDASNPPLEGTVVGSSVQIIQLPDINGWYSVTAISEPTVVNGTVRVTLTSSGIADINVLFLNLQTVAGPGSANQYA
jgi:hypothetical protein